MSVKKNILDACRDGSKEDLEIVKFYVKQNPKIVNDHSSPTHKEYKGKTPLMISSKNGRVNIVRFLMGVEQTNPNLRSSWKKHPAIYFALRDRKVEVVKVMLFSRRKNTILDDKSKRKWKKISSSRLKNIMEFDNICKQAFDRRTEEIEELIKIKEFQVKVFNMRMELESIRTSFRFIREMVILSSSKNIESISHKLLKMISNITKTRKETLGKNYEYENMAEMDHRKILKNFSKGDYETIFTSEFQQLNGIRVSTDFNFFQPSFFVRGRSIMNNSRIILSFPLYDDFNDKRKKNRIPNEIYVGECTSIGLPDGYGYIFTRNNGNKSHHHLSFMGHFENGVKHGRGIEYELSTKSKICTLVFEGQYQNGLRHGRGDLFDTKQVLKGRWVKGVLDPSTLYNFDCPVIHYQSIHKNLKNARHVGSGAFGVVYAVRISSIDKNVRSKLKNLPMDEKEVAFKITRFKPGQSVERELFHKIVRRSVGYCSSVNSPNILELYGIIQGNNVVGSIMKRCETSIDTMIRKGGIRMDEKLRILKSVACGMNSLHSKLLIHRDLKWENVLIDRLGTIKICDFDTLKEDETAWKLRVLSQSSRIGTPGFRPPEVVLGNHYSVKSDVFSFGMMIYSLLFEHAFPFYSQPQCQKCGEKMEEISRSFVRLDEHVTNCGFRPLLVQDDFKRYPEFLLDLMVQCWDSEPFNRPSFEEILLRFDIVEGKKFSRVKIVFSSHPEISSQKIFLSKPFRRSKIVEWVEKKFLKPRKIIDDDDGEEEEEEEEEKTEVLLIEHSNGTILCDDDLRRILKHYSNPTLRVRLSSVDKSFVCSPVGQKMKNSRVLEREIMKMKGKIRQLEETHSRKEMEWEKERKELLESISRMKRGD